MAEFGANVTEVGPTQAHDTVKEGVVKEPYALQGLAKVFSDVGDFVEGKRESRQQAFLSEFTNQQLAVIQAVDQGVPGYSSRFARTKLRNNLIQAIESHQGLREELLRTNSTVLGQAGMGGFITSGTKEEIRFERMKQATDDAGLTIPGVSTDNDYMSAANVLQQRAAAEQIYQAEMDDIRLQKARLDLTSAERAELDEREKRARENVIVSSAPTALNQFTTFTEGLISNPNMSQAEKNQQLEEYWINLTQEFSTYIADMDSTKAKALTASFQLRKDLTEKLINEELEQAEFDRRIKFTTSAIQSRLIEDPEIAQVLAISELFAENAAPFINAEARRLSAKMMNQNSGSGPAADPLADPNDAAGLKEYLSIISKEVSEPSQKAEQKQQLAKVLEGLGAAGGKLSGRPDTAIPLVDWMASSEFLRLRNENPELFDDTSGAEEVLSQYYYNEVEGLIRREFTNSNVFMWEGGQDPDFKPQVGQLGSPVEEVRTPDAVGVKVGPNGVTFVPFDSNNSEARKKAESLNGDLKRVINQTVKSSAHLQGRTDYANIAKEQLEAMFGEDVQQDDTPDNDLVLEDFSLGGDILNEALTTGGYIGDGDYQSANTPEDVAASFIGFDEEQHEAVISSFIRETTGNNINPSTTAWCAAFINAALGATGQEGTDSNLARSFLNWGETVTRPQIGDVVVLERGSEAWQGHVGFFVGKDKRGNIRVLGGNQGNKVSIKSFPPAKLLGYRRGKADVQTR